MKDRRMQIAISCLIGLAVGAAYLMKITAVRREIEGFQDAVEVVAARTSMRAGDRIVEDALYTVSIPRSYLPRRAVLGEDMEEVIERFLIHPVPAGDPVLWTDFPEGPRIRYPSEAIPSGFRALALPADEVRTLSHLLVPGDRVDIAWTHYTKESEAPVSDLLCQNIAVFAVGQRLSYQDGGGIEGSFPTSVTLLVSPTESLRILEAAQGGEVTFLARDRQYGTEHPSVSRSSPSHERPEERQSP